MITHDTHALRAHRIALISDIHGNFAALEAVLADVSSRSVSVIVNLGDSLSGPLLPRETARALMDSSILSLAGNHERQILELRPCCGGKSDQYAASRLTERALDWIRALRHSIQLNEDVLLCHGTPDSDCTHLLETLDGGRLRLATQEEIAVRVTGERSVVVACGHSHVPRAVRTLDGRLMVNPGSVGLPAYEDHHPAPYSVETGAPDARYAILEKGPGGWSVEHICLSYDHESMAKLAETNDRPDWARALRTGYI